MKRAALLVIPSREDPFPLVALEAMALGVPVVAFRKAGGICEALDRGAGYCADEISPSALADAIEHVLNDKQLYASLRERGPRVQAEFYDKTRALDTIFKILKTLRN